MMQAAGFLKPSHEAIQHLALFFHVKLEFNVLLKLEVSTYLQISLYFANSVRHTEFAILYFRIFTLDS